MAKPSSIKIRLNSTAKTGFFYVTKKNNKTMTEKMEVKKYDPVARKHVLLKKERLNNHLDKILEKTFPVLNSIEILGSKPTLICDADEVIFDFMNELLFFKKINYPLIGLVMLLQEI